MKKSIAMDLKRLLINKTGMAVLIFAPVVILLCFGSVIAPVFFNAEGGFSIALLVEDTDPFTASVVESLVKTEQNRSVLTIKNVYSLEEGKALLNQNEAVCLIQIPQGFQRSLLSGGKSAVTFYENAAKPLECAIIKKVLSSGITLVNEAQKSVNALYASLYGHIPVEEAKKAYSDAAKVFLLTALNKSAVFKSETVSPLGALQPLEYYAASLLVIFLSLNSLGLSAMTSSDNANGVTLRHLLSGRRPVGVALSRTFSGALFVLTQGLPLLILYMPICIKSFAYGGNLYLMPLSLAALSLLVSSFAYCMGNLFKGGSVKVFAVITALLFAGGAVIPLSGYGIFSGIAAYTPFSAALKTVFNAFFFFEKGEFTFPFALCLVYALLFFAGGYILQKRRV